MARAPRCWPALFGHHRPDCWRAARFDRRYLGGWIDGLISRMTTRCFVPVLILAIALAAFLGPSLGNAMIAIGVTTTPIFVRLTRGR